MLDRDFLLGLLFNGSPFLRFSPQVVATLSAEEDSGWEMVNENGFSFLRSTSLC